MKKVLRRYTDGQRLNHWFFAIMFFAAMFSGLALFHPAFYFLTNLFGGGSWTRILHPFMGVIMVLAFLIFALRLIGENRITAEDREWRKHMGAMMRGNKEAMPPAGKFNYGQKMVYWVMLLGLLVLLVTGILFWRPWFDELVPIPVQRVAVLLHAIAAVGVILVVIVHIYAAFWVKGTIRAMSQGTVTDEWAALNHPLWRDRVVQQGGTELSRR